MSSLLRSPAIRRALLAASSGRPQGVSFLRAASGAAPAFGGEGGATVRRGLGLLTVPRRYLSGQNGQPTAPPPDQAGQALEQVQQVEELAQEVEELVQKDVDTFVELYREMRIGDHGYFERLLSNSGVPKSPSRDRFVWSCQLGIIFAGSWMVGYLKSE
ncbi:uncharacterized protein LOC124686492 [Lolium rigidum]|uniref:uncharacterized protein LOC124686492 n=1 Tax=Lolium rigidum TaxID=89674 RepID=UPI001F5E1B9A|nr:uncharacterized protein LOC124686492 [Lolium rigidum]